MYVVVNFFFVWIYIFIKIIIIIIRKIIGEEVKNVLANLAVEFQNLQTQQNFTGPGLLAVVFHKPCCPAFVQSGSLWSDTDPT